MGRPYTLARRAERVDETRRRILEAAVELHGTLGPARTTISAVAERAGVQRLTVYRHFPDERALFRACSHRWLADHPPPDIGRWVVHGEPEVRLRQALRDLYAYFGETAAMWDRVYRDAPLVPALRAPMEAWEEYLGRAREAIVAAWRVKGRRRRRLDIAAGHAVAFTTWASLTGLGADPEAAIDVMAGMVNAAATPGPAPPGCRRAGRHTRPAGSI